MEDYIGKIKRKWEEARLLSGNDWASEIIYVLIHFIYLG